MIISVWIDARTEATLRHCARSLGRTIEDLAESAVAEAAIRAERGLPATPTESSLA